jgi:hypothetical protein
LWCHGAGCNQNSAWKKIQIQTNHIYSSERLLNSQFPLPQELSIDDRAQERDESALMQGLGSDSSAPASSWSTTESTLIEIRAGIWEALKRQPKSIRAQVGSYGKGRLFISLVST